MTKVCSKCGNPLRENDKFCRKCGTAVAAQSPAPQAQAPASSEIPFENPEGTVLLGNMNSVSFSDPPVKQADIRLALNELLEGCRKVVDFGTGKKYELSIPPGLTPGDVITVESPDLVDGETGRACRIELTVRLG